MQIRITDISTDKVLKAFSDLKFGIVKTNDEHQNRMISASIWSEVDGNGLPCGYEIAMLRLEMSSFTRHELIIETNRIETDRLTSLLGRIASENR